MNDEEAPARGAGELPHALTVAAPRPPGRLTAEVSARTPGGAGEPVRLRAGATAPGRCYGSGPGRRRGAGAVMAGRCIYAQPV
ncbi:hypothetical protein GCM10009576_064110 [Streptomyces rhizosphaericus]|uniref:Uncharacterized protein n=1 Tax=Streptomyces rhizosphaericus TaxID=114699 RepID=A0ABP4D5W0_9ACTN